MKVLHTSDWHLGQELMDHPRSSQQEAFLSQLLDIVVEHKPDALIVSGDIYQMANPSAEAKEMFLHAMLSIHHALPKMTIVITSGNHDSASQIAVHSPLWKEFNVHVMGGLKRLADGSANYAAHILPVGADPLHPIRYIAAVPYVAASNYPTVPGEQLDANQRMERYYQGLAAAVAERNEAEMPTVLMGHLTVCNALAHNVADDVIGNIEGVDASVLDTGFDYVALGHIHKPSTWADGRMRYCGSPLACSFDEAEYPHSVSMVTLNGHERPVIEEIPVTDTTPLITYPAEPAEFDDAIEALSQLTDDPCMMRLNILTEAFAPANGEMRVAERLKELGKTNCQFCRFKLNIKDKEAANDHVASLTADELASMEPIDLIKRYFEVKQTTFTPDMQEMIQEAINQVTSEKAQ